MYQIFRHALARPVIFRNAWIALRRQGFREVLAKTRRLYHSNVYRYRTPALTPEIADAMRRFGKRPLISIVMPVYNVDPRWLAKAVESVKAQWYDRWELCIVDDASSRHDTVAFLRSIEDANVKIEYADVNANISAATNRAVALAEGDYIALMDHDDELTPDALYEMVRALNETDADFLYSDEDFISPAGRYINPHFKPDFSPDLLLSHNYITHFALIERSLFETAGGFRSAYDGAQDYDLFLRLSEQTPNIVHIPKVLYHWRMIPSSVSADSGAKPAAAGHGKKAVQAALERRGIDAEVLEGNLPHYFRVRRRLLSQPLVSIVIPFKDRPDLLRTCLDSILERSSYARYEIIGVSNDSSDPATYELMREYARRDARIRFVEYNHPFNYSKINNFAVFEHAKGEHVVLLNNDIELITDAWIETLLEHSQRPEVGCVGAKLYYGDGNIQHAGVILGLGGYAAHSHRLSPRSDNGYFNRLNCIQNLSAVTAACMMVKTALYRDLGGLDETHFTIAYNDVDFCLRVREHGYLNVFTPYCEAYHYESLSRGEDAEDPAKTARFDLEKANLKRRHGAILANGDPYYNVNLTTDREDFSLKPPVHPDSTSTAKGAT